jgi:hypothetical protein
MAFAGHISEHRITAGVVAGVAFGIRQGILVDADLSSLTAAKAAVDADVANLHISQRMYGARVKASLDKASNYQAGYVTGTDADAIYSIEDLGTASRGLALYL